MSKKKKKKKNKKKNYQLQQPRKSLNMPQSVKNAQLGKTPVYPCSHICRNCQNLYSIHEFSTIIYVKCGLVVENPEKYYVELLDKCPKFIQIEDEKSN